MTSSPSTTPSLVPEQPMVVLRYLDLVLLALGAPIMLLIGVSPAGYLIAAGVWAALRAIGIGVERAGAGSVAGRDVAIRLTYMLGRLFALAMTVILVRRGDGRAAGLAALLVIVFAFTIQLGISAITRPRSR